MDESEQSEDEYQYQLMVREDMRCVAKKAAMLKEYYNIDMMKTDVLEYLNAEEERKYKIKRNQ
jgi:hypothetical protein